MLGDPCCDADALSCDDPCDDGERCAQDRGGYDDGDDPRSALTQYVNYLNRYRCPFLIGISMPSPDKAESS